MIYSIVKSEFLKSPWFVVCAFGAFFVTIATRLINPYVYTELVTSYSGATSSYIPALLFALLFFMARFFKELQYFFYLVFEQRVQKNLVSKIMDEILGSHPSIINRKKTTEIAITVDRGLSALRNNIYLLSFNVVPTLMETFVVILIIGLKVSTVAAIATGVLIAAYLYTTNKFSVVIGARQANMYGFATKNYSTFSEIVSNHETVRALNRRDEFKERYFIGFDKFVAAAMHSAKPGIMLGFLQGAVYSLIVLMNLLVIYSLDGTLADLILTAGLLVLIMQPLQDFTYSLRAVFENRAASFELMRMMKEKPEVNTGTYEANSTDGLVVKEISISSIIKGSSLIFPANGIVAITGQSGSGKSTFCRAIAGLEGFDGKVSLPSKEYSLMYLHQHVQIFDDDLCFNVSLSENGNEVAVKESLRMAGFDDVEISELQGRNLGDGGSKISGGQKKRLGLARLFYYDADFIIFDEPTSELDALSATQVIKTIIKAAEQKPIICITHDEELIKIAAKVFHASYGVMSEVK